MTVTIDASVWVAAGFAGEPGYAESRACLLRVLAGRDTVVLPWLAWVECVAAVARKTDNDVLAHEAGRRLREVMPVRWVSLDETGATEATNVAAICRLRAADAVYVAVARQNGATLVTLDRELQRRCATLVRCQSPEEWSRD
jgi:predicted nucleic acid-binding protein